MEVAIVEPPAGLIPSLGARWNKSSLLWRGHGGTGTEITVRSPIDQSILQTVSLLSLEELDQLVCAPRMTNSSSNRDLCDFCERLYSALLEHAHELEDAMVRETGFIRADCRELMDGSLCYVRDFMITAGSLRDNPPIPLEYLADLTPRRIRCVAVPWGTIAVVAPQNAFLLVALTCILNALLTGNRVILRAPQLSARSASILAVVIDKSRPPKGSVSVVLASAKEFLDAVYRSDSSCLIHYMGSSAHAPHIVAKAFQSRKNVVVDGQGNCWVYVAADACIDTAVRVLTQGAVRYNGQTCTSINGAVIAPSIFPLVRDRLKTAWASISAGNPLIEDIDVGPLFDQAQASHCLELINSSGGKTLTGGLRQDNLLQPTLIESPEPTSELVTDGVFGCSLWISPGTEEEFISHWSQNRYPLCAGIISESSDYLKWMPRLGNLARLTFNGDPSIEYLFEPWGGYPGSGLNSVGLWSAKYQRTVQIDEPDM